jgi:hypothetical protein
VCVSVSPERRNAADQHRSRCRRFAHAGHDAWREGLDTELLEHVEDDPGDGIVRTCPPVQLRVGESAAQGDTVGDPPPGLEAAVLEIRAQLRRRDGVRSRAAVHDVVAQLKCRVRPERADHRAAKLLDPRGVAPARADLHARCDQAVTTRA